MTKHSRDGGVPSSTTVRRIPPPRPVSDGNAHAVRIRRWRRTGSFDHVRRGPAAPEGGAGDREARRNVCVQCESNGLATKRRFGQIRHGVEWRPAMFRVASVSVKCGRGGGPDLASIGDDDIPYVYLNNDNKACSCPSVNATFSLVSFSRTSLNLKSKGFFLTQSSCMAI